jgi:hypothetical protein
MKHHVSAEEWQAEVSRIIAHYREVSGYESLTYHPREDAKAALKRLGVSEATAIRWLDAG